MQVLRLAMVLAVATLLIVFAAATAPYFFRLDSFGAYAYILGLPAGGTWFVDWYYWR